MVSDSAGGGELSWLPSEDSDAALGLGVALRSTTFRLRHVVSQLFLETQVAARGDGGPSKAGMSPALCEAGLTLAPWSAAVR